MMTPTEATLHRQLLEAFDEYIQNNLLWDETGSLQSSVNSRKALRKIIDIAYLRWKEVQIVREGRTDEPQLGNEFFRELVKKHSKVFTKKPSRRSL